MSNLALLNLYDLVVARFAQDAGASWTAPVLTGTGTSVPGIDASSSPSGSYDARILVTAGGTVGTAGIKFKTSIDGGATWSAEADLGTALTIAFGGVTVKLGAGTLDVDDEIATTTTAETAPPEQSFGWRRPDRRGASSYRIVWVPGELAGAAGPAATVKQPGRDTRPLATLQERFTVFIEARDDSAPRDERAQYERVRLLFDAWYRAVYLAAFGTFRIEATSWVHDRTKELQAGASLRVDVTIEAMIPDAPLVPVLATLARVAVTMLEDETETVVATPAT